MLTAWKDSPRLKITIPAKDEELVDFPLLVRLSASSGLGGFDCSEVFSNLGSSSLKIAVEVEDTGVQCYVEIQRWDDTVPVADLWVKVTLSATEETTLLLYYDSAQGDNSNYVGAVGTKGVLVQSSTALNMLMNGEDASTTFTDLTGKSVTRYGNTCIKTTESLNGGSSAYFDGSNDYLILPGVTDPFEFGTGDFYIRIPVLYPIAPTTGNNCLLSHCTSWNTLGGWYIEWAQARLIRGTGSSNAAVSSFSRTVNIWNVITLFRKNGIIYSYTNGVKNNTSTDTNVIGSGAQSGGLQIGKASWYSSAYFYGYIDSILIENGEGRTETWAVTDYLSLTDQLVTYSFTGRLTGPNIATPPLARRILAFDRNTLELYGAVVSDGETGAWELSGLPCKLLAVAAFDDSGAINAEIFDGVTPGIS